MHIVLEINEKDGKCGTCGNETMLITTFCEWKVDNADTEYDSTIEINEEVTAHYCKQCSKVTAFWINT